MGRHTTYNEDIGQTIIDRIIQGESITQICKDKAMPSESTVWKWNVQEKEEYREFQREYARARDLGIDRQVDRIIYEIDNYKVSDKDKHTANAKVQVLRIKVDTLKWYASKLAPKRYGDRIQVDAGDNIMAVFGALAVSTAMLLIGKGDLPALPRGDDVIDIEGD